MTPLALHNTNSVPDAWHDVRSPGGYEWWYFDAEDPSSDRQLVAIFLDGFVFHPGYLRAYARYDRSPTRHAPPLPREFPCVYFVLYEKGAIRAQFMTQFAPADFRAGRDRPEVTIGPNRFDVSADGILRLRLRGTPWKLTWQGPKLLEEQTLSAELSFTPVFRHEPVERTFLSRQMTKAEHQWVIANPRCAVSGEIVLFGAAQDGQPQTISFSGKGYHDHNYGTAPIGRGLARWIWGRVLLDRRAVTFHFARACDKSLPDEVHLVDATSEGIDEVTVSRAQADWSGRTPLLLRYPKRLSFDSSLVLERPRVVDSSPFYLRLMYDAAVDGEVGTAFCEVAYPHRLGWPVLGRMIEMSIDKRSAR